MSKKLLRSRVIITALGVVFLFGMVVFWFVKKDKVVHQNFGVHNSYFLQSEIFDKAFASVDQEQVDGAGGLFVNHHLLAPHLIAKSISVSATNDEITVVLISPNHFYRGDSKFITSRFDWQTPYGVLFSDQESVDSLEKFGVSVDESPFAEEHGVSGITPFVKKAMPNAKIVPLIIKEYATDKDVDDLAIFLAKTLPKNALVIGSFDISHYLINNAADFDDEKTLAVIDNFDYAGMKRLDVDSKAGLRLMLKYLQAKDYKKFNLLDHTNAAKIINNLDVFEPTSYITGYFTKGEAKLNQTFTGLYYGKWSSVPNAVDFYKIERLLMANDILLGVGPENANNKARLYNYHLGLNFIGTKVLTVRGDQVLIASTRTAEDLDKSTIIAKPSIALGFAAQPSLAKPLIDKGFDVVFVDSQNSQIEIYKNKPIFYGLANQPLDRGGEVTGYYGAAIGFVKSAQGIEYFIFPVYNQAGKLSLIYQISGDMMLKELANTALAEVKIKEQIKLGRFSIN